MSEKGYDCPECGKAAVVDVGGLLHCGACGWGPDIPGGSELLERFVEDFAALVNVDWFNLPLNGLRGWQLLAAIQLACRHPQFGGPVREAVEHIGRALQYRVAVTPALKEVAEMGWRSAHDVEIGA